MHASRLFSTYPLALLVAGVGVMAVLGYAVLAGIDSNSAASVPLSEVTQARLAVSEQIERELIQELQKLNSIILDDSLFSTPEFTSLVDYSRRINDRPRGRENPFAPF